MEVKTNGQVKAIIPIPKDYRPDERAAIAQDIIDYLIERTREGKGEGGKKFSGTYSESYAKSLEYKLSGKKKGRIDLTLTGEMLDSLLILTEKSGELVIGYEKDDEVNGRAEGNILGSYGGDPNPKRARNFLALTDKEIRAILARYPLDDKEERRAAVSDSIKAGELARSYLGIDDDE